MRTGLRGHRDLEGRHRFYRVRTPRRVARTHPYLLAAAISETCTCQAELRIYVTGVGHTARTSARIRSGEIIIPSKCGTKGGPSPILDSGTRQTADTHTWHGRSSLLTATTQRRAFEDPLDASAYAGAAAGTGVAAGVGAQAHRQQRDRRGYTVSGYVAQVLGSSWAVSAADAAPAARRRLPRSGGRSDGGSGASSCQRGGGWMHQMEPKRNQARNRHLRVPAQTGGVLSNKLSVNPCAWHPASASDPCTPH